MKNFIKKYKIYIIISIVGIVILLATQSFKKDTVQEEPIPVPTNEVQMTGNATALTGSNSPAYSRPPENLSGGADMNSEKVKTAIESKEKLEKNLPIYIENFKISNGMSTTLNVYTVSSDPGYLIHIEIYGIDFNNQDTSKDTNPNVVAFIESFEEIKKRLAAKGVDIHNIYFIFGQRAFIQETADLWIRTYGLL